MGIIKQIAEFDQFLYEQLEKCQNKKNLTYLSKTVHEELIGIVGNIVPNEVINQVN